MKNMSKDINKLCGIRESETRLAQPTNWVIEQDRQALGEDSLYVGRPTKILDPNTDHSRYMFHIKQMAKYVVDLHENLSPTDVEEGMRVGVEKKKYKILLPL
jgi:26S proteasome regulatory subunit T1